MKRSPLQSTREPVPGAQQARDDLGNLAAPPFARRSMFGVRYPMMP